MGFFRKRDDEPVDPNERSPELGLKFKDLAVLGQFMEAGTDLSQSRHLVFYSYAPSSDVGQAMAVEAEANGFAAKVREPLPDFPGQWSVVCEIHEVASPDFVREADDFFEAQAERHGAEYERLGSERLARRRPSASGPPPHGHAHHAL
jgi:Regulator of ribonuclease activity B